MPGPPAAAGTAARMAGRPTSPSGDVVGVLRRMILVGELPPGSRATQDELAQRLGVSTMPVRKALLRLAAEGLIEVSPRRSFRVVHTTADDIRDVYWMQARIAGQLADRAAAAPKLLLTLRTTLRFIPDDFYCLVPDWAPVSERGHRRILEALAAKDPAEARAAAEDHVREAADLLLSSFSSQGFWQSPVGAAR